tara:strand:+ start:253 stop:375 length:123 start_codon:yes stop_codon:yes gene_type:complete
METCGGGFKRYEYTRENVTYIEALMDEADALGSQAVVNAN